MDRLGHGQVDGQARYRQVDRHIGRHQRKRKIGRQIERVKRQRKLKGQRKSRGKRKTKKRQLDVPIFTYKFGHFISQQICIIGPSSASRQRVSFLTRSFRLLRVRLSQVSVATVLQRAENVLPCYNIAPQLLRANLHVGSPSFLRWLGLYACFVRVLRELHGWYVFVIIVFGWQWFACWLPLFNSGMRFQSLLFFNPSCL